MHIRLNAFLPKSDKKSMLFSTVEDMLAIANNAGRKGKEEGKEREARKGGRN